MSIINLFSVLAYLVYASLHYARLLDIACLNLTYAAYGVRSPVFRFISLLRKILNLAFRFVFHLLSVDSEFRLLQI